MTTNSQAEHEQTKARHADLAAALLPDGPLEHFIGGEWCVGSGTDTFPSINPTTGETLVTVYEGTKDDVDHAVTAAWDAYENRWSESTPAERQQLLQAMADRLEARADDFARIEVLDNGKPITEARQDIELAVDHLRYFAAAARNLGGKTVPNGDLHIQTRREPYGGGGQAGHELSLAALPPEETAAGRSRPGISPRCLVIPAPAHRARGSAAACHRPSGPRSDGPSWVRLSNHCGNDP